MCKRGKEMRAFIAGIIDKNQVNSLVQLRDALAETAVRSRSVPRENLHITLEFLGDITEHQADAVCEALDSLSFRPLPLVIDKLGAFRSPDGSLVWAGSSRAPELAAVQRRLHRALKEEGFKLEERRFLPHVTLLRKALQPVLPEVIEPIEGGISGITLFKSELRREGPLYTPLHTV